MCEPCQSDGAGRWEWIDGHYPLLLTKNGVSAAMVARVGEQQKAVLTCLIMPDADFAARTRTIHLAGQFPDPDAAVRQYVEHAAKAGRWPQCPTCPDCGEVTLTARPYTPPSGDAPEPSGLGAELWQLAEQFNADESDPQLVHKVVRRPDCTGGGPVISGPPYPSWQDVPDEDADSHSVHPVYLDDDRPTIVPRWAVWVVLMTLLGAVFAAGWIVVTAK